MCECYQVGGRGDRFIAEDPDCPVHGYQAQQAEAQLITFEQRQEETCNALESLQLSYVQSLGSGV